MSIIITENADEKIIVKDNCIHIFIDDLFLFTCENIIDYLNNYLVENQIASDDVFNRFDLNMEVRKDIYAHILGKIDYETLKEKLENSGLSTCDIIVIYTETRRYFRLYNKIKESVKNIDRVMINCNADNILRALIVARDIKDKTVILNCGDMKMFACFDIIRDIDINYFFDANIAIYFNGPTKAVDFYKFFLANKCLAWKAIEDEQRRRELEEMVCVEEEEEVLQSEEDMFPLQDVFTPLLEKHDKKKNKTRYRTRRNKINILN